jgi:TPP-dependent pyruvate/acetoin dehydrogenase alpha subunit
MSKQQPPAAHVQPAQNGFSLISNGKLLALYSTMLKCRMIQGRIRILFRQNNFTGNHSPAVGREAAAVGVAIDLAPEDTVAPPPGDLIPLFINGLPLETLFGGLFHPVAPSSGIAARLKIATDAALANKLNKNNKISVALSTSEPASLGPWHEALSFAGLHSLPMVFVSWTTLPPQSLTLGSQTKAKGIPLKTKAYSFPSITVDGNDAVAVYRVAHEAIAHARLGHGPTLIKCKTCRWKADDPIMNMENYLTRKGLFTEEFKSEVVAGFNMALDAAIEIAERPHSRKAATRLTSC